MVVFFVKILLNNYDFYYLETFPNAFKTIIVLNSSDDS